MQLFFSYGHDHNAPLVERLRLDLKARRYKVWVDKYEIKPGDEWRRAITEGILSSDTAFSFASTYSLRKPGVCLDELSIAVNVKGAMVQSVLLERGVTPTSSTMFRNVIDMCDWVSHVSEPAFLQWYEDWKSRMLNADKDKRSEIFDECLSQEDKPNKYAELLAHDGLFREWYQSHLDEILQVLSDPAVEQYAHEIKELRNVMMPDELNAKQRSLEQEVYSGRAWLKAEMTDWMQKREAPRILLITGRAGVGKSSFVAHELLFNEHVGAAVYCEWNNPSSNSPERVARSIAYQLACRFPDYRRNLLNQLKKEQSQREQGGMGGKGQDSAFRQYVVMPLSNCIDGDRTTTVIIIDGVDELERASEHSHTTQSLPSLLMDYASQLPPWIRFVITCRNESSALDYLRDAQRISIDETGDKNMQDVREYTALILEETEDSPVVHKVLAASDGVFLHAALLCEELKKGWITEQQISDVPQSLGLVYRRYFDRMFADSSDGGYTGQAIRGCFEALSVLVTSPEPVPTRTLRVASGWDEPGLTAFLQRCGHFVEVNGGLVSFWHKSIVDWLGESHALEYQTSASVGWRSLANACYTQFENGIRHMNDFEFINVVRFVDEARMTCAYGTEERGGYDKMLEALLQSKAFGIALLRKAEKYLSDHQYDLAESCCSSCVRVYEHRMHMEDDLDHTDDVRKFGRAYRLLAEAIDLSVRLQEAIECCEEGMRELEDAMEVLDGCEIVAYDAIGALATKRAYIFYRRGGKQEDVESGFWDAYRWFLRSGNQSGAAEALIRLGISHRLNGSYAKALECIELVEDSTDVDALEKQDPSLYVYVRVYEGDFYIAAGRFLDAEKCLKDAERVTAQPWANVSMARKAQLNLEFSYLYYNTGEYEKSEKYGREALRLEIDVYGDKSVESCNGLNQIGWCLLRQGRLEDAYTCFRESYDIRLRLYTEKNPFTLVSLRNCAITHKEMGGEWLAEAKVEFERVLALRQELCKQDAQAPVAGAHLDLCSVLLAMNLPTEALEHAKRAEEIFRLSVGDKDNNQRSYALCYASIGESLLAMDAPSDALPWLRKAVSLYEDAYGADSGHHNLLHARQLLSEATR